MIINEHKEIILKEMLEALELPPSAYEKAKNRYEDLGEWFGREQSALKENDPHIFPQGSFRLGTAIRPLDESEEYDLDLACKLRKNVSKNSSTQKQLKQSVGDEIEKYRIARGIESPMEEKHRCWRLEYQDDLSFHMDIVPCIPEEEYRRSTITANMRSAGEDYFLAEQASQYTVSITDDRHNGYDVICDDWKISNPEGYAIWFESRMHQISEGVFAEKAQVDNVPTYMQKKPLQRAIQFLKRHRDKMYKDDPEVKPISIIITTLAGRAYRGEADVESALRNILTRMGSLVNKSHPKVPNPVDPKEDFADRWYMPEYAYLRLEENFWNWLRQAQSDFDLLGSKDNADFIVEQARQKFSVGLNVDKISKALGLTSSSISIDTPKVHRVSEPAKPWMIIEK